MAESFCNNIKDPVVRDYCTDLVKLYKLQLNDLDTGTAGLDLTKSEKCNVADEANACAIPPTPDGQVTEPEVMQQVINFAEQEYVALVNSLRSDGKWIPTPFLDIFYKSGGSIPWLFNDPDKLAAAVKKTQDLSELVQSKKSPLQKAKSLYGFLMDPLNKDGYQIDFCNAPYRAELNIDEIVEAGSVRCNEFDILMLGFGLLVGGPEMDIVATVNGYGPEHMFMGLQFISEKDNKYYIFDPAEDTPAKQAAAGDTKKTIGLTKSQLMSIYYSEELSSCPTDPVDKEACIKESITWATRYAPDFFVTLYSAAVGYFNLGLYDLSKKYLQSTLEVFPGLTTDTQL